MRLFQVNWSVGAMAKGLYTRLFHWLVKKCNKTLDQKGTSRDHFIGVLDIAGFEIFDVKIDLLFYLYLRYMYVYGLISFPFLVQFIWTTLDQFCERKTSTILQSSHVSVVLSAEYDKLNNSHSFIHSKTFFEKMGEDSAVELLAF